MVSIRKARKNYTCEICEDRINNGTYYVDDEPDSFHDLHYDHSRYHISCVAKASWYDDHFEMVREIVAHQIKEKGLAEKIRKTNAQKTTKRR